MIKQYLKKIAIILGTPIYKTFPKYTQVFLQEYISSRDQNKFLKILQKIIVSSISNEYYSSSTTTQRRIELINMVISRDAGVKWANYYLSFGFTEKDIDNNEMFLWINTLLEENSQIKTIHQVACSSGREIAFLAQKFTNRNFVGSDIDTLIVENCYKNWQVSNLEFDIIRLENIESVSKIQSDVVYSSGSLQYLDYNTLNNFFEEIIKYSNYLFLAEPVGSAVDIFQKNISTKRGNFSWNHNYGYLLEKNGWILEKFYEKKSASNDSAKNIYIKAVKR